MHKLAISLIALVSLIVLSGCESPREQKLKAAGATHYGDSDWFLITVNHDNHLFVVEGCYSKGAMLHHPSCPCMIDPTSERAEDSSALSVEEEEGKV